LTDDSACSGCHGVGKSTPIAAAHFPVTKVKSTSSGVTSYYATNEYLPTGAYKIEYIIDSVTVDSARKPSVKFKIKKDGADVVFGTYDAATNPNIIPNTIGGPSIRIAYNNTQDGITSPLDTNAYMSVPALGMSAPTVSKSTANPASTFTPAVTTSNIWASGGTLAASGITWTLTGPDSSGFYTVSGSVPLPASTTIATALMYGSMTQTNVAGYPFAAGAFGDFTPYLSSATETSYALTNPGLILSPPNSLVSSKSTGFSARRTIVDNAKCLKCHDQLGIAANFHGGGRNNGTDCFVCHTENSSNTGWSYGANTFIHAIHATSKRTVKYTFGSTNPSQTVTPTGYYTTTAAGTTATQGFFNVGYPGLLKNCEQCHVPGGYDFTLVDTSKLLPYTVATGKTAAATYNTAPYIDQVAYVAATSGTDYGSGFAYSTSTGAVVTTAAAGTTLVNSPISAACFACHDTKAARAHMENQGGSIYAPRSTALAKTELCTTCHGKADNVLNTTVPTVKAVHRWW
jgi:OmcA/MtrC family decaheme c-type cytochrome